ncbi:MAG: hypothetical protein L6420_07775 [Elusimicrobia bacterium]|nr:hypothetical protein [Elusimicrobiota bacterium]
MKRSDMFGFRNPGLMRVPIQQAINGGISDCRNRRIQDMFRYVGFGDHASSGVPKIYRNWQEQHWRAPQLLEFREEPERTVLLLRMISLIPEEVEKKLDELFGRKFRRLPELERIILITAAAEDKVSHSRIKEISPSHPKDISVALSNLVQKKMLIKEGETRGSIYHLPNIIPALEDYINNMSKNWEDLFGSSQGLTDNSQGLTKNSQGLTKNSQDLPMKLDKIIKSLGMEKLPKKLVSETMQKIIIQLCDGHFVKLDELSKLLNRNPVFLQQHYISLMVSKGLLELKYPSNKNHPDQAYRKKQ